MRRRAAELLYYGEEDATSTTASGDLCHATQLAEQMICHYGMDEEIGMAYLDHLPNSSDYAAMVRTRINDILSAQLKEAVRPVEEYKPALEALTEALLARDHLREQEIATILSGYLDV